MIIECPSCKTKFAVDATQLEGVTSPRFHCSRCDHFFDYVFSSPKQNPANVPTSVAPDYAPTESLGAKPKQLDLLGDLSSDLPEYESATRESSILRTDERDTHLTYAEEGLSSFEEEEFPDVSIDWPDQREGSGAKKDPLEVDLGIARGGFVKSRRLDSEEQIVPARDAAVVPFPSVASSPPRYQDKGCQEKGYQEKAHSDSVGSSYVDDEYAGRDFARSEMMRTGTFPATEFSSNNATQADASFLRERTLHADSLVDGDLGRSGMQRGDFASSVQFTRNRKTGIFNLRSPYSAVIVPLFFMLLFFVWGQRFELTPPELKRLFYLEPKGLPQLAPAGLEVLDLQSSMLTLDDGKRALEVRGSLLNATTKTFTRVRLDARLFDKNNTELRRLLVSSQNELLEAKVESLSEHNIDTLQSKGDSNKQIIEPNSRSQFRIIFAGIDGEDLRWFSTKIYSVESAV